jgi:hypothetical protein
MNSQIVSVDAGNGGVNAVMALDKGRYRSVYFPSVRAAATGDSLGLGKELELQYNYVDWYGHRYVVGDDVLRVTRRHMERHSGPNRYGNEMHQQLIATAVAQLGVKEGGVDLTLFAPPGIYVDAKRMMEERLRKAGEVTLQLKGDRKPRSFRYETITIWPEGVGAVACFILDDSGELVATDLLDGETLVLDLGFYTLDALRLVDGNFNPEELEHATFEHGGVMSHVLEPILRVVRKQGEDFSLLTADDVDRVIRLGLVSEDYTLMAAGYELDLAQLVAKHRERYAEWIANHIVDNVFAGFRGIRRVILVGGGALLVEDYLREWYGDKLLNRRQHAATRKIHPVDFNAVGGLRFALRRLKQGRAV